MKHIILFIIITLSSLPTVSAELKKPPTVLVVLSSHYMGYWASEVIDNYNILNDAGINLIYATPDGKVGLPNGMLYLNQDQLKTYRKLAKKLTSPKLLTDVDVKQVDAIFFPGGLGPMFDMYDDKVIQKLIEEAYQHKKIISSASHGSIALAGPESDGGKPLLKDRLVTGVSLAEENAWTKARLPFMLETKFKEAGAIFSAKSRLQPWVVQDGLLITGQNANSIVALSKKLTENLLND